LERRSPTVVPRRRPSCPSEATAAAGEAAAEEIHALLERHRQPPADQLVELPFALRSECIEPGLA
jgi:hypothetical protein